VPAVRGIPAAAGARPARDARARAAAAPASGATSALTSAAPGAVVQLYRHNYMGATQLTTLLHKAQSRVSGSITGMDAELCYNVELSAPLTEEEAATLQWLLRETFEPECFSEKPFLADSAAAPVVEVGPRLSFSTAWATNALSICQQTGLSKVTRIEASRRYAVAGLGDADRGKFAALVHDRMTEQPYAEPVKSFKVGKKPDPVATVDVMGRGRAAMEEINEAMGLAFDEQDLDYYTAMFRDDLKRNPTDVELFDIGQSNSEHSRHWFFGGNLVREDGTAYPKKLFDIVKEPFKANPNNSVIAFKDNSSTIRGFKAKQLLPTQPGSPSPLALAERDLDLLLTAETHNFPCAVAPYPGAETGAGGRIRDTHATGRGSLVVAATAGYCVGNLQIPGYQQPWEDDKADYPGNLASPLQILIDASNGASGKPPSPRAPPRPHAERAPRGGEGKEDPFFPLMTEADSDYAVLGRLRAAVSSSQKI